jgi:hypothetical protein
MEELAETIGYGLEGRGSIPDKSKDLSLSHHVQIDHEAHPASYQ